MTGFACVYQGVIDAFETSSRSLSSIQVASTDLHYTHLSNAMKIHNRKHPKFQNRALKF